MPTETADQETSTDAYARRFSGDIGKWFLDVQGEKVSACLKLPHIKSVLEIGGGHGQLVENYLQLNLTPTIYSSHSSCAHRVQSYIDSRQINFAVGDLVSFPYPDQSFDAVVAIRLLAHCDAWQKLISEMCRVAKHVVVVDYPPLQSFNFFYKILYKFKAGQEGDTRPFTVFDNGMIQDEFSRNNFELSKNLPQFFAPMVIYRKLKSVPAARLLEGIFSCVQLTRFFGSPTIACFRRSERAA